jgi:hypothetical protein
VYDLEFDLEGQGISGSLFLEDSSGLDEENETKFIEIGLFVFELLAFFKS